MKRRRDEAFLATKTKERTRDGSMRMIEKSLQLLQTDHVDLWQLHDIGTSTTWTRSSPRAAPWKRCSRCSEQKVVRYLGVTGHYRPEPLMDAIHRHPFDTILMAMNAADPHHYSFSDELLPLAVEKQMGIIGMKMPGRGRLLSTWTPPPIEQQKHSWEGMTIQTHTPGHADHARSHVLHAVAAGEHGHHRLRLDRAARGERAARARVHAAERHADGVTARQSRNGFASSRCSSASTITSNCGVTHRSVCACSLQSRIRAPVDLAKC